MAKWYRAHGAAKNATALRDILSGLISDAHWQHIPRGSAVEFRIALRAVKPKPRAKAGE